MTAAHGQAESLGMEILRPTGGLAFQPLCSARRAPIFAAPRTQASEGETNEQPSHECLLSYTRYAKYATVAPQECTSDAPLAEPPWITSGAIQNGVPILKSERLHSNTGCKPGVNLHCVAFRHRICQLTGDAEICNTTKQNIIVYERASET